MIPNWLQEWKPKFEHEVLAAGLNEDPAHDLGHIRRVVATACSLAEQESAKLEVVYPAAYLHDIVNLPKNHPDRSRASRMAADYAIEFLAKYHYPEHCWSEIRHAIESHSFSAKIAPETIEAKVVQDADRLDAIGAVGLARVFIVGGKLNRRIYDLEDPWAEKREFDDLEYTIDHFFIKLLHITESLQTQSGRREGKRRMELMTQFLDQLKVELVDL